MGNACRREPRLITYLRISSKLWIVAGKDRAPPRRVVTKSRTEQGELSLGEVTVLLTAAVPIVVSTTAANKEFAA